jgi:hypothetical protein
VKDTVGFEPPLMLVPLSVPDTVAVPVTVLFSVAVYVPSPLSVTALRVPSVLDSATVAPPESSFAPLASLACTVIVEVEDPSAVTDDGETEIVVFEAATGPTNVTVVG